MNNYLLETIKESDLSINQKKCIELLDKYDPLDWATELMMLVEDIYKARAKMDIKFLNLHLTSNWKCDDVLQIGDFECCYEIMWEIMCNHREHFVRNLIKNVDESLLSDESFFNMLVNGTIENTIFGVNMQVLYSLNQKQQLIIDIERLENLKGAMLYFTPYDNDDFMKELNKLLYSKIRPDC